MGRLRDTPVGQDATLAELFVWLQSAEDLFTESAEHKWQVWRMLLSGRVLALMIDSDEITTLLAQIDALEYDPVLEVFDTPGGQQAYRRSDEIHPDQRESTLAREFRHKATNILKRCIFLRSSMLRPSGSEPRSAPAPRLSITFIKEDAWRQMLTDRWEEAWRANLLGMNLSSSILLGSVLEAALTAFFAQVHPTVRSQHGLKGGPKRWKLADLISAADAEVGFRLQMDQLLLQVKDSRNQVHPYRALQEAPITAEAIQTNFAAVAEFLTHLDRHAARVTH